MDRIKKQEIGFTLRKEPLVICKLEIMHRYNPGKILAVYELVFLNTSKLPFNRQALKQAKEYLEELLDNLPRKDWNRAGIRDLVRDFMSEIPYSCSSLEIKPEKKQLPAAPSSLHIWHARNGDLLFAFFQDQDNQKDAEHFIITKTEQQKLSHSLCGHHLRKYDLLRKCNICFNGKNAHTAFKKFLDDQMIIYKKMEW